MKIKKNLLIVVMIATLLLLSACTSKDPQISVDSKLNDFGNIDPVNGKISKILTLTNKGNSELVIESISTSCGCTTAKADKMNLQPGESTNLNVTYDPWVHEGFIGEILRVVYVQSNDPQLNELEIDFKGNVLDNYQENYQGK